MASIIKANQLQDFGGNSIITSDGAGNVTVNAAAMKNTPAFFAYKDVTQTAATGTATKVTFATELFDTNSNFASSTFTPTTSGKYFVTANVSAQGNITTAAWICWLYKNGTAIARTNQYHSSGEPTSGLTTLVNMNGTTDTLEIYLYQTSGSTQTMYQGQEYTYFGAYKIIE